MSRYIRAKQLEQDYGIDRVTVWRWGRDPKKRFPRPIRLSRSVSLYDVRRLRRGFGQGVQSQRMTSDGGVSSQCAARQGGSWRRALLQVLRLPVS